MVPAGYLELLEELKRRVAATAVRAAHAANTEVIALYWSIGRDVLQRQEIAGWGAGALERLANDLRAAFPDQRGFSRRNLQYMRALAAAWPSASVQEFVQQPVAHLPWGHVTVLLARLDSLEERTWYAQRAVEHGWSRAVTEHQIMGGLRERTGAAPSNFADHLPAPDSELAQQLTRDPYVFDHLNLTARASERQLEQALMDRLQATLLALGHGMAFVGRQVRFDVDGDVYTVDLLFFHVEQLRYVVIELKKGAFEPGYLGQLSTSVAIVDDRLRRAGVHAPSVGILLCTGRNEAVVRYALASSGAPVAVATYEALPADQRAYLPDPDQLSAALAGALHPYQDAAPEDQHDAPPVEDGPARQH